MKKQLYTIAALLLMGIAANAQVGIGTTTPDASSILQLESTNKGLRLPKVALTTTTTFGLTAPTSAPAAVGMTIYNTTAGITSSNALYPAAGIGTYTWDGTGWAAASAIAAIAAQDVRLVGTRNHITSDAGPGTNGSSMPGGDNIALGSNTMISNSSGTRNVAMNTFALQNNTTGSQNIAIGQEALNLNTTASDNIALGFQTLKANTIGANNIAMGNGALKANTIAPDNIAIGNGTLTANTGNGTGSIAIGALVLNKNTGAFGLHVGIGYNALQNNTTGYANVGMGYSALGANTSGSFNTSIGTSSMTSTKTGDQNTSLGYQSMYYADGGGFNTAVGTQALQGTVTTPMSGSNNVGVGYNAGAGITTGTQNVAVGKGALAGIGNSGNSNTAVGFNALNAFTSGGSNVSLGEQAIGKQTTGNNNIAIGAYSAGDQATGSSNISIGAAQNFTNLNGSNQLNIGNAIFGTGISASTPKIGIGTGMTNPQATLHVQGSISVSENTGALIAAPGNQNFVSAGANSFGASLVVCNNQNGVSNNNSNMFNYLSPSATNGTEYVEFGLIGGTTTGSITKTATGVAYNTTSDVRLKENIRPTAFSIADVMKIDVRDYNYKAEKDREQTGFIAQQLYTVFPNAVTKGSDDPKTNPWQVDYSKVTPLLVKAIQDQQTEILAKDAKINALEARMTAMEKAIEALNKK